MASATTLLRRSSAGVIGCGRQVYCRYLSGAAKRSHIIIPTSMSSIRQFATSTSPKYDEAFVKNLLSQLHDLEGDIEALRKQNELLMKPKEEAGTVKRKHPILREIESVMWKTKFTAKVSCYVLHAIRYPINEYICLSTRFVSKMKHMITFFFFLYPYINYIRI